MNEPKGSLPLPAWIMLTIAWLAALLELNWVWGLLSLAWMLPDLYRKHTYLGQEVSRKEQPVTYWAIMATWTLAGIYLIAGPFLIRTLLK